MRKLTSSLVAAAIVVSGLPMAPAGAQTRNVEVTPASLAPTTAAPAEAPHPAIIVANTINAFPSGGEPLRAAIADLVIKDQRLATAVALHIRNHPTMPVAQKDAVVAGLGDALNRLGIVAQAADGVDPLLLALIAGGAGAAGFGIYQATRNSSSTASTSPN